MVCQDYKIIYVIENKGEVEMFQTVDLFHWMDILVSPALMF